MMVVIIVIGVIVGVMIPVGLLVHGGGSGIGLHWH